ncbi:MAG: hypothetical protein ACE5I1_12340, partial [bacterium]
MRSRIEQNFDTVCKNGEIVERQEIKIESILKEKVSCTKIKYLSDGLRVVGFILKPRAVANKCPVLIFNRAGKWEEGKITARTLNYLSLLAAKNYVVLASQYRGNDGGEGCEAFGG